MIVNHMENLKKLRMERGLSQQKLADKVGMTQQAIHNYENGINEPDIYTLKLFADFFHTSVDYLVNHTDNPILIEDIAKDGEQQGMNARDRHHLMLYRKLSENMQGHVDAVLEAIDEDSDSTI